MGRPALRRHTAPSQCTAAKARRLGAQPKQVLRRRGGGAGRGGAGRAGLGPVSGGEAGVVGGGEAVIDALDGDIRVGGDVLHAVEEVARPLEDDEAPAAARGGVCVWGGVESCGGQGEGRWGIPPRPATRVASHFVAERPLCGAATSVRP